MKPCDREVLCRLWLPGNLGGAALTAEFAFCGWHASSYPRSPGTHIVGPWVMDDTNLYRDLRTGTQYIGNWASRVTQKQASKATSTVIRSA